MPDPAEIYEEIQGDLEEAIDAEYRRRLNTDSIAWITESLSEIDYGTHELQKLIGNLAYVANTSSIRANCELGELFRWLVRRYTTPNKAWIEDKERELFNDRVEDAACRSDLAYDEWKENEPSK